MTISNLRRVHAVVVCAVSCALAACHDATGVTPTNASANVVINGDSTIAITSPVLDNGVKWMTFPLDVSVINTGRVPFQFYVCSSSVEQEVGNDWQGVWSPVCAVVAVAGQTELQPGTALRDTISVVVALSGPAAPKWNGSLPPGNIRFRAGIIPHGVQGVIPTVASNKIRLVLRN